MMLVLIFAASLVFQDPTPAKGWIDLTNLPGWQGYGQVLSSGWIVPERFRRTDNPAIEVPPARPGVVAAAPAGSPGPSVGGGDPYGFLGWFNGIRARSGLGPVVWDGNLAAGAARNSEVGFGHFIRTGRRQGWMTSPDHLSAMLDPTVTRAGIAVVRGVWTLDLD